MAHPRDVLLRVGGANLENAKELLAQNKKVGPYKWKTVRDLLESALDRGMDDISVELAEAVAYEEQYGPADAEDDEMIARQERRVERQRER